MKSSHGLRRVYRLDLRLPLFMPKEGCQLKKYLGPTTISARKKYSIGGIEIMNKKKHTRSEQKKAWDCYVRRLTSPIAIHHPTKEEKVMLRKAGYIIK